MDLPHAVYFTLVYVTYMSTLYTTHTHKIKFESHRIDSDNSEKTRGITRLQIELNVHQGRSGRQTRHGRHVSRQRVDESRASAESQLPHRQHKVLGSAQQLRIVGERQRRLGDADGQLAIALLLEPLGLRLGLLPELHAAGAVDGTRHSVDLGHDAHTQIVREPQLGTTLSAGLHEGASQV
uniref:Uncharacterized protein n=1 Tax=Ixodes ricinus TaxID=34613 RepID=A0A6B0V1F0_IXORI